MQHTSYLNHALELAKQRRGYCAPNPAVGAVVVKDNTIIGQGTHLAAGHLHAEIVALNQAGDAAKGATLYVTLEPCAHTGHTPPCVDAILEANIKAVFFAYQDPNPLVAGKGQKRLQKANVFCQQLPHQAIHEFYRSYHHWTLHKTPWVTAKIALSCDGKIAHADQAAVITGELTRRFTHEQRQKHDAILTTINTVLIDDPQLNIRLDDKPQAKPIYLLDSQLRLPLNARLMKSAARLTVFHQEKPCKEKIESYKSLGIRCIALPHNQHGLLLKSVLQRIGQDGIHDLWVEAGGQCFNHLLTEKLANEVYLYFGVKTLGPSAKSLNIAPLDFSHDFEKISWQCSGNDVIGHLKNCL